MLGFYGTTVLDQAPQRPAFHRLPLPNMDCSRFFHDKGPRDVILQQQQEPQQRFVQQPCYFSPAASAYPFAQRSTQSLCAPTQATTPFCLPTSFPTSDIEHNGDHRTFDVLGNGSGSAYSAPGIISASFIPSPSHALAVHSNDHGMVRILGNLPFLSQVSIYNKLKAINVPVLSSIPLLVGPGIEEEKVDFKPPLTAASLHPAPHRDDGNVASGKRQRPDQGVSEVVSKTTKTSPKSFNDPVEGSEGERRLVINFERFGTKGQLPQTFGQHTMYIPDGLVGTHTAYEELWRFEIHHTNQRAGIGSSTCCIRWRLTNIKSGDCVERTETPREAEARLSLGWTIASQIFREALRRRADQLEIILQRETNPTRLANLRSVIRALRPKSFTQGPLVFGLKHRIVQEMLI
jgi:hypothetical protein